MPQKEENERFLTFLDFSEKRKIKCRKSRIFQKFMLKEKIQHLPLF